MRRWLLHPVLAASFLLVSCGEDSVGPKEDPDFSLEVEVHDPTGAPVEGLDVVLWNFSDSLMSFIQDHPKAKKLATVVELRLEHRSICDLGVRDLEGRVVEVFAEGDTLEAGRHQFAFHGIGFPIRAGVEVFRCSAAVRDVDTQELTYENSIYMTAVVLSTSRMELSQTDASGRVRFEDPELVPGLYELPVLQATDETGEAMGTFELGSSVQVRVLDQDGHWMDRTIAVGSGANTVQFTWDPALPRSETGPSPQAGERPKAERDVPAAPSYPTRLTQNYPNPFN